MSSDPRGRAVPLAADELSDEAADRPVRTGAAARTAHGRGGIARVEYETDWSSLMAAAQAGDADAYRRLLESVTPYLRALASRRHRDHGDIEDAVQDILLTVHQIRASYDPARPFGPWLVAIANRRLVDRLRRQGRTRSRETTLEPWHETFPAPEANLLAESQERRALHAAVAELPPRQREAITLVKLQELSLREASAASGMSIASLKVSVHRGMKSLRKILPDRSDEN